MSFNLEVQGGKSYLLPTGGKYCPQDIALTAIGGKEGLYSWQKSSRQYDSPSLRTFNGITSSMTDGVYAISGTSGDGWGKHNFDSEPISAENNELELVHVIGTLQASYFIGFAETVETQYANIPYSLMFESGKVYHYAGAARVGQIGTVAVGDSIQIKVKDGWIYVYKAGALLKSFTHTLSTIILNATFYQGSKDYGTIGYSRKQYTKIGFVVDDDPNAYPNGGVGEGRYYYDSVSKVEMKLATGTASGNTVTVTGLAFRPQAIYMIGSFYSMQTYYSWANAMFSGNQLLSTNSGYSAGGMSINSASVTADGFSVATSANASTGWTWYALGY